MRQESPFSSMFFTFMAAFTILSSGPGIYALRPFPCTAPGSWAQSAFPTPQGLIYGTDSPFETNSIRLLKKVGSGWESEFLHTLAGPCIYACQVKDKHIFSTSLEPGEPSGNLIRDFFLDRKSGSGIKDVFSEIVCGNIDSGFETIKSWPKDVWPPRLCQLGTIIFPSGENPTSMLYA